MAAAGADQVKVTGHKTVRSMDQTQADKTNEAAPLDISGDANNVVIRIRQDQAQRFERITATLEISVPKGSSVEVHGAPAIWILTTLRALSPSLRTMPACVSKILAARREWNWAAAM